MSEIKSLLAQMGKAANEVVAKIRGLDEQIDALVTKRNEIADAPLAKSDLMEYVREDIKRRAESFPTRLKMKWARDGRHLNFINHERVLSGGGVQMIPYLDGEVANPGIAFKPDAFFWMFGELIEKRFEDAINNLYWPDPGLPLADRRGALEKLNAEIDALQAERDELAEELQGVVVE
ncbi:MAG: hypothetical protein HZY77_10990 [Thiobacillus sp.]|uniref:hypothetical protein n=1 Tax=Thiobacillus sp. TaxID=924 RepID=UPI00168C4D90|nr:hypothetical protein [Thiobacillus sp.]QLQ03232.1 MAG: hypothetical protein HZY77_10990 [Thiobacillus sp.]